MMCELLKRLLDLSDYHWKEGKDLKYKDLAKTGTIRNHERMTWSERCMASEELDSLINNSRNSRLCLDRFYLPPLDEDREFIPILSLKCNLISSPPSLSLRVGMTKYTNDGKGQPVSLGFRFEMGHPGQRRRPDSDHNYHHMQLTARPHGEPLFGCPELPETYPCVPTPAKCPITLFLCMLLSLYGTKISKTKIFTADIDRKYKVLSDYLL